MPIKFEQKSFSHQLGVSDHFRQEFDRIFKTPHAEPGSVLRSPWCDSGRHPLCDESAQEHTGCACDCHRSRA